MLKKIFVLSIATLFASCSTSPDKGSMMHDDKMGTQNDTMIMSNDMLDSARGTQEDLVAYVGDRVFFGFDSAALGDAAEMMLQRQAKWMKNNPEVDVIIEGHCDNRGTREYNFALGEKRAHSVKKYLMSLGVDEKRLKTVSYGKEKPAVVGSGESIWLQNRRSVTVVAG